MTYTRMPDFPKGFSFNMVAFLWNAIPTNRDEIGSPKPDKPRLEWIKNLGGYLENAAAPARQGFHNKIVQWAHIILLLLIANWL